MASHEIKLMRKRLVAKEVQSSQHRRYWDKSRFEVFSQREKCINKDCTNCTVLHCFSDQTEKRHNGSTERAEEMLGSELWLWLNTLQSKFGYLGRLLLGGCLWLSGLSVSIWLMFGHFINDGSLWDIFW